MAIVKLDRHILIELVRCLKEIEKSSKHYARCRALYREKHQQIRALCKGKCGVERMHQSMDSAWSRTMNDWDIMSKNFYKVMGLITHLVNEIILYNTNSGTESDVTLQQEIENDQR